MIELQVTEKNCLGMQETSPNDHFFRKSRKICRPNNDIFVIKQRNFAEQGTRWSPPIGRYAVWRHSPRLQGRTFPFLMQLSY